MLGFFVEFNPYYKEGKYFFKTEPYFFDYIYLDDNANEFIETFKNLNFEVILVGI